jgi:GNAT superfamily N-acetyltransferase
MGCPASSGRAHPGLILLGFLWIFFSAIGLACSAISSGTPTGVWIATASMRSSGWRSRPGRCGRLTTASGKSEERDSHAERDRSFHEREDLVQVSELSGQLGYPVSLGDLERRFSTIARREDAGAFRRRGGGRIVGWTHVYATHLLESPSFAEIGGLVVRAGSRRIGAGRALVEAADRWAREQRLDRVRVRSNVLRTEAHRFYPACGFKLIKTQHNYEREII